MEAEKLKVYPRNHSIEQLLSNYNYFLQTKTKYLDLYAQIKIDVIDIDTYNRFKGQVSELLQSIFVNTNNDICEQFNNSGTYYRLLNNHVLPPLDKYWGIFFMLRIDERVVGIVGLKYKPAGETIRIKEENRKIYPQGCLKWKLADDEKLRGKDGLLILSLPAFIELGPAVVSEDFRHKGIYSLLSLVRINELSTFYTIFGSYLPRFLSARPFGTLSDDLSKIYEHVDKFADFIGRNEIPDHIWKRLGETRPESRSVEYFASKVYCLEYIGFGKSTGGSVCWGDFWVSKRNFINFLKRGKNENNYRGENAGGN